MSNRERPQYPANDLNEILLDELTQRCGDTDFSDQDLARLDALFTALETDGDLPEVPQEDVERHLAQLHQQRPTLTGEKKTGEKRRPVRRTVRRIAVLAAVLVLVISAVSVQASGNMFQWVAQWTSQIFQLTPERAAEDSARLTHNDMKPDESRTYGSVAEMIEDLGVRGQPFPNWVPERFGAPADCGADELDMGTRLHVMYEAGDDWLSLSYYDISRDDNSIVIEKDQAAAEMWTYGGIPHYHISDMDLEKVMWVDGDIQGVITGSVSQEELQKVIASIYAEQ